MTVQPLSNKTFQTLASPSAFTTALASFDDKYGRNREQTALAIRTALIERDAANEKTSHGFCSDAQRKRIEDKYNGNLDLSPQDFQYISSLFNGDIPPLSWFTKHPSEEIVDVGDRGWRKKDTTTYTLSLDTFLTNLFN